MNVTSLSSISKETVADGVWFNDNIISAAAKNLSAIADGLDDNGLANLPNYFASAKSGVEAWNKVKSYDFDDMSAKAMRGASAWFSAVKDFKYDDVSRSAYSGFRAAQKILPYDIDTIKQQAELGYDAYTRCSAYNMLNIQNSAKDARAGYNAISANKATIEALTSTCDKTQAITAYGKAASAWCVASATRMINASDRAITTEPTWDKLLPYSANAERQKYLTDEYTWLDANKDDAANVHQALTNSAKWCSAYNEVITKSGDKRWTDTYNILHASGVRTATGMAYWDDIAKNANIRNAATAVVNANSGKWNQMHDTYTAADKPAKFYNTFKTYSPNWYLPSSIQTYVSAFPKWASDSATYQKKFYTNSDSLSAMSGKMNFLKATVASGETEWPGQYFMYYHTNWYNLHEIVERQYGHAKWNDMAFSAYRTCAFVCVVSSHSANWDKMATQKGDWWYSCTGQFNGQMTGASANFKNLFPPLSAAMPSVDAAMSACSGKSYNWTNVNKNISAWNML